MKMTTMALNEALDHLQKAFSTVAQAKAGEHLLASEVFNELESAEQEIHRAIKWVEAVIEQATITT